MPCHKVRESKGWGVLGALFSVGEWSFMLVWPFTYLTFQVLLHAEDTTLTMEAKKRKMKKHNGFPLMLCYFIVSGYTYALWYCAVFRPCKHPFPASVCPFFLVVKLEQNLILQQRKKNIQISALLVCFPLIDYTDTRITEASLTKSYWWLTTSQRRCGKKQFTEGGRWCR